ncbi:MAG TPA: hypothetical protein VHM19_09755 [Polyangiales bacterium]|jgi:hypothetical protein|nr:hypothetical protein [Polyangiales bacterium]
MAKKDAQPELVEVASAIEEDLQHLEELSVSVTKLRLNTEKNIGRAARTLQEALQQQEQLAARLQLLGGAMLRMQQRQQQAINDLGARANEIQAQFTRLGEHMARFGELGKQAAEVTQMLQALPPPYGAGEASPERTAALPSDLLAVEQRLTTLSDDAKTLESSAEEADLSEVSKEAMSLRQRVDAARQRLGQIAKAHLARAN